jgi:tyrosine decarboxylase/aspartate 1-decarboxylase
VIFALRAESVSEASALSRRIFDAAAKRNLHLAVAELPTIFWAANLGPMRRDRETMTCLRSVLMKSEHLDWIPRIWDELSAATSEVLGAESASRAAR